MRECFVCRAPMKLDKQIANKAKYRTRRFKCTVCDFSEMIAGGGYYHDNANELFIQKDVEKMFKQEEDARS